MLLEVIARARRRLWLNALAFQLAIAATVGMTALVLLLLLGTDVVDERWLLILPLTYLVSGAAVARRRLPAHRSTAQLLDHRLHLADSLSTAFSFITPGSRRCTEEFRRAQNAQATQLAAGVNLRTVLPVRMPRVVYCSAALAVAATALFVVRYRSAAHLDLRAPIAGIVQQLLENARSEVAKLVEEIQKSKLAERMKGEESATPPAATSGDDADAKPSAAGDSKPTDANSTSQAEAEKPKPDTFAGEEEANKQGDQLAANSQNGSQRDSSSQSEREGSSQQQQAGGNQSASSSLTGSSVVNKIKDSLANMLSALKPPPGGGGQQAMKAQEGGASGKNQKQEAKESGDASGEPGEGDSPKPGSALAGGAGQAGKSQSDKQQGTGAGTNDGSKEIRLAQQLEAMGKLGAIFGKRAENISGEFTVEAPPGPQNLRTAYVQRAAEHSSVETTGIRDEVPAAFQDYVQHYYDLIRQEDASSKPRGGVMSASTRRPRNIR